jgi:zinc transport system ATP-binding protein
VRVAAMATSVSSSDPVLDVRHLTVRFGDVVAIRDLTFAVPAGEAVAVIGPNGAGKTALFRALIDAVPYEGSVHWAPGVRLGYVPQKLDLQRDVPVSGLDFLGARTAIASGSTSASDVDEAIARVGLTRQICRRPIGALSGGQFQRLLVAFALVGRPNVLLLDEPTAGVDEVGQEHLNEVVHRLEAERGMTVFLISHDLSVVYRYASTVICLGHGTAAIGPPNQMLNEVSLREAYGTDVAFHSHGH